MMVSIRFLAALLGATCAVSFVASAASPAPRPNVLIFYVDDMGWGSIGPNGQAARREAGLPYVKTPNLDRLAAEGVNFQRGYGCTVCSPARSSMLTGYHQGHTWADRNHSDNAKKAIRSEDLTMGDVLKDVGYATGYWGKWGYGGSQDLQNPTIVNRQTLPNEHGFDHVLAELHHLRAHTFFQPTLWSFQPGDTEIQLVPNTLAPIIGDPDYPDYPARQNHPDYPSTAYCDDSYAFATLDFVRARSLAYQQTGQPFLAFLSSQIPHSPFGDIASLPEVATDYADEPWFATLSPEARNWAIMVTRIDAHFGNILDALEDPNQDGDTSDSVAENTLVIFLSDNGDAGSKSLTELGSNADLRGQKGSIWEGGIRVPLVMRWPARIHASSVLQAGTNSQVVFDATDLLPTLCELAGAEIPLGIDGVSKAGLLMGTHEDRSRDFVVHEAGNHNADKSIIRGNHKLVDQSGTRRLFDLAVSESTEITGDHPDLVTELAGLLEREQVFQPAWTANTYHQWIGADGGLTSNADHWSDYTYTNAVNGITYQTDNGSPQPLWVATMRNEGATPRTAKADGPLEVLALEVSGASQRFTLEMDRQRVVGRNEVRIGSNGRVLLSGGRLESQRWIEVRSGGVLEGDGEVAGTLYHAGEIVLNGREAVSLPAGADELLANGGFESGSSATFSGTDDWFNAGGDQSANARNTSNPNSGSYRAIIGNGNNGLLSPAVNTGHLIGADDVYRLSFAYAGAANWDLGADTITAELTYFDDQGEQMVGRVTVTPTQSFTAGYDQSGTLTFTPEAEAVGRSLFLRFLSETVDASGEFASLDDVSLVVERPETTLPASRRLLVEGDYEAEAGAALEVQLAEADAPGIGASLLDVRGLAVINGGLRVMIHPDLTPTLGQTFEIVRAEERQGRFDLVDDLVTADDGTLFVVRYSSDGVRLEVTARTAKGTPYSWLEEWGLLGPGGDYEAVDQLDHDSDGFSAWEEFRWGTDPTSAGSRMWQSLEQPQTGLLQLNWHSRAGRTYWIERSPDLIETFTPIAGPLEGTPPRNSYPVSMVGQAGFFRVRVE